MATATTAPAEITPASLPADDGLYEVVQGQVVEKVMGAYEVEIGSLLIQCLGPFVTTHRLGKVVGEMLFRIDSTTNLQRRPDVAFVSDARWPHKRRAPKQEAWEIVPDLAIEVVSPTNTANQVVTKVREYFQAGVQRVWVIFPDEALVYVYASPTEVQILGPGHVIDGGDLLPGFRLPVGILFEDEPD